MWTIPAWLDKRRRLRCGLDVVIVSCCGNGLAIGH